MTTVRLTVAQATVRFLAQQFSERDGFRATTHPRLLRHLQAWQRRGHRPGTATSPDDRGSRTPPTTCPGNEQAMVHASVGFARMRNRLQALACTASIGPGSTNMLTGAALATINRIPVLLLASDTFATRAASPVLQELESPQSADISVNDAFRPLSRFFDRVERPEQLPSALLGDARPDRPCRDGCRDYLPPPRCPGRSVRLG